MLKNVATIQLSKLHRHKRFVKQLLHQHTAAMFHTRFFRILWNRKSKKVFGRNRTEGVCIRCQWESNCDVGRPISCVLWQAAATDLVVNSASRLPQMNQQAAAARRLPSRLRRPADFKVD